MVDTTNPVQDRDNTEDATGNFVELFKKSFTSYVENGMRQLVEKDIDLLRNEEGGFSVTKDFKAKFYKFIVDHYLRKFYHFYLQSTSNHCLHLPNTAQPGGSRASVSEESAQASEELKPSASGVLRAVFEMEQENKQKITWLQKLKLKLHRRQRA